MVKQKFKQTEIGKIPEDWEARKIGELAVINELTINKNYPHSEIEYIDIDSVNQGHINESQKILLKNAPSRAKRIINDNDTIISTVRPNLKHFAFIKKARPNSIVSTGFAVITPKKIAPGFLYYFTTTSKFINYLSAIADAHTSTYPSFNPDIIENFEMSYPKDKQEQISISKILSSLDDKIELNNKMNKTLEAIGQALFKKLFVDERKKEWKDGFLGDNNLTEILGSGINEFSGEKIYIATADVENSNIINYTTKITFDKRPSRANMQPIPNSVWFAKMKDSKKVLSFDEYNIFEIKNLILSTGFTGLKVKPESLYYIWNFINNESFEEIKNNLSIGTTMQGVNNDLIKKIKVVIPDQKQLIKFNSFVKPIYEIVYNNILQNQNLSQIRDALLPKLMSGEIRVK